MTNVYLYGELQNKFGEEFKFNINSAKEALLAINANKKGFLDEIKKLAMKGVHYRIVIDDEVVLHPKEVEIQKAPNEIHILPIVWGAGKNGMAIGMIVVGALLIAATGGFGAAIAGAMKTSALAAGGAFATLGTTLGMIGASIAVQGVMSLLTPKPKADFNQEVQAGGKSYLFGNKPANASQGQAIPVGYGRLKIGSSQISASTDHYALATDIKQLMTPVDKPINEYVQLIADDEAPPAGPIEDMFSTNQAVDMDDTTTFYTVNVLNSYIDIVTNSASKVFSNPVEVVVTKNGNVISNPDLTTYDEDIAYEWEPLAASSQGGILIENPYAVNSGLAARSYHAQNWEIQSNTPNLKSSNPNYFRSYSLKELVKYGPSQFNNLKFGTWDSTYIYYSGELVNFPTGTETNTYFQTIKNNFFNEKPTGAGNTINSTYWRKIREPRLENLYKCVAPGGISGHFPTTGAEENQAEVVETQFWSKIEPPTNSGEMELLFTGVFPAYEDANQFTGILEVVGTNQSTVKNVINNIDNYGMEFIGYFYVPTVGENGVSFVKDLFEVGTATGLYEIIKIGATGQWSGVGFTGIDGTALTPRVGSTFVKNNTQPAATVNGKIMQVQAYEFKLDSDDASDLYIDSTLASSYYGGHGMFSGFANPLNPTNTEINNLPSTVTTLYLTAGYHRLYARFQEMRGGDGISIYYRRDTNRDDKFSDWQTVPKGRLFHAASDLKIVKDKKFANVGKQIIPATQMVNGKKYKIFDVGNVNWTSIGASRAENNGTVAAGKTIFVRNSISLGDNVNGSVVENFINYSEQTSAQSNRIVRFISQRPLVNGRETHGYTFYKARYRCRVTINKRQIYYSAPVKINIDFLTTSTRFIGLSSPELNSAVQAT